jgi:hypothetical protein
VVGWMGISQCAGGGSRLSRLGTLMLSGQRGVAQKITNTNNSLMPRHRLVSHTDPVGVPWHVIASGLLISSSARNFDVNVQRSAPNRLPGAFYCVMCLPIEWEPALAVALLGFKSVSSQSAGSSSLMATQRLMGPSGAKNSKRDYLSDRRSDLPPLPSPNSLSFIHLNSLILTS